MLLNNGKLITEQQSILEEIHKYYSNLFEDKDASLQNINFDDLGIKNTATEIEDIGNPLEVKELGITLKK